MDQSALRTENDSAAIGRDVSGVGSIGGTVEGDGDIKNNRAGAGNTSEGSESGGDSGGLHIIKISWR